ncbi:hypothetical protein L208DRAFT_1330919, partial [Tricholoma matsutake]
SVEDLAPLCSEKWLASRHMDLFGKVLQDQLHSENVGSTFIIKMTTLNKLLTLYRYEPMSYPEQWSASHIQKLGEALINRTYTKIAMSVSIQVEAGKTALPTDSEPGNHWVTVILDVEMPSILYRDSYKLPLLRNTLWNNTSPNVEVSAHLMWVLLLAHPFDACEQTPLFPFSFFLFVWQNIYILIDRQSTTSVICTRTEVSMIFDVAL